MKLKYGLEDKTPLIDSLVYGLQWMAIIFSANIFLFLLVTQALGFNMTDTALFVQRSLVFLGLSCLLQVYLGHRLTIFDVVATFWLSTFIFVAYMQQAQGVSLSVVLGKLLFLQMATGGLMFLVTISGLADRLKTLFSPVVMGVTLILICIQMSANLVPGMMQDASGQAQLSLVIYSLVLFVFSLFVGFRGGVFQPYIGLIGLGGGWISYRLLGLPVQEAVATPLFVFPRPFEWGMPVVDWSLIPIAFFIVMIFLSNGIASANAAGEVLEVPVTKKTIRRMSYVSSLGHVLAAVFSSIVVVPAATSAGLVATTKVGSRRPMVVGGLMLILLGIIGPLGSFFATIPPAVSYSVSLSIITRIMYMGLKNCYSCGFAEKEMSIASISIVFGTGISFIPNDFFQGWGIFSSVLGNGLFMGVLLAIFLEKVMFRSFVSQQECCQTEEKEDVKREEEKKLRS